MFDAVWSWNATASDEPPRVELGAWEAGIEANRDNFCTRTSAVFTTVAAGPHSFLLTGDDLAQLVGGSCARVHVRMHTRIIYSCIRLCACVRACMIVLQNLLVACAHRPSWACVCVCV
jgi:hypothetical protein